MRFPHVFFSKFLKNSLRSFAVTPSRQWQTQLHRWRVLPLVAAAVLLAPSADDDVGASLHELEQKVLTSCPKTGAKICTSQSQRVERLSEN